MSAGSKLGENCDGKLGVGSTDTYQEPWARGGLAERNRGEFINLLNDGVGVRGQRIPRGRLFESAPGAA
eukprot:754794-Hanusia_phi.AAC.1